jgi:hypothetical protein
VFVGCSVAQAVLIKTNPWNSLPLAIYYYSIPLQAAVAAIWVFYRHHISVVAAIDASVAILVPTTHVGFFGLIVVYFALGGKM